MDKEATPTEVLLGSMVALMVADREARLTGAEEVRSEVILVAAGVSIADAARLTGKNYEAVKKSVQRAKAKAEKGTPRSTGDA